MAEHGVYVEHRYGHHNGAIKVRGKGGDTQRSTQSAMLDKCRYNETRFAGEENPIYDAEGGVITGGYREAYMQTSAGADRLAASNRTGRSRGRAYIYDTTINPGVGRLSNEAAHQLAQRFRDELSAKGYRVDGYQYAIHQGTEHTHLHVMYASHKTLQLKELRSMQGAMRRAVEQAQHQDVSREATTEHQADHGHARGN